jgi:DNA polymerase (family X)
MTKDDVAAALDEIGTLLALQGENDFRTKAYHNAARTVSQLQGDIKTLIDDGTLKKTRGIGEALLEKITTLVETGELPYLTNLRSQVPQGLRDMLRIPSLGPKKVMALNNDLGIESIEKLKEECEAGNVAKLKGFGEKTQDKILEGIRFLGTVGNRIRIDLALAVGEQLLKSITELPEVQAAELCGSLRRRRETAKDIDIVAASDDPAKVMDAFVKHPAVLQVVNHGATKSSIVAQVNIGPEKVVINADLRVVTEEQFPFAVLHFTGSKEHNIRLRQRAIERGLTLNEYALTGEKGLVKCDTEAEIYAALDLVFIEPEMREDTGEVEVSEANKLPALVRREDIRGVFHNHTLASDGRATLEQMALATKKLGLEYFGVGDHSQSLTVANGLTPDRIHDQWAEIDQLNKKLKGVQILKGTECDILDLGKLDYDDELLSGFDYVVISVHSKFNLSEEEQTERICKALAHPSVTMLGHPTGRLLLRREGYKLDMEKILQAAAKHHKMIEINAQPDRLDLDWKHVKRAKALGIPLVINPDAHSPGELSLYEFGVNVARRGWLTAGDVFNTKQLKEVLAELANRKKR